MEPGQFMERIDDGPLGAGSKFRAKWKLSKPLTLEITRYDAPHGWSYTNDGPIEVDLDIDLLDHADRAELRCSFGSVRRSSAADVPVLLMAICREESQNIQHLKRRLEGTTLDRLRLLSVSSSSVLGGVVRPIRLVLGLAAG